MNQIIAAIMLFGVITAVFAPLIAESGLQMFSRSSSIRDTMERTNVQTGQVMVATNTQQRNGVTSIFVSNIGVEDVRIHTVLVDGMETPYMLLDQDGMETEVLAAGDLGVLEVTGGGERVQVITDVGKLIDFSIR